MFQTTNQNVPTWRVWTRLVQSSCGFAFERQLPWTSQATKATTPSQLGKFLEVTHTQLSPFLPKSELYKSSLGYHPSYQECHTRIIHKDISLPFATTYPPPAQSNTTCPYISRNRATHLQGSSSEMHRPDPEPRNPQVGVACWNVGLPPRGSSSGQ